MPYWGESSFTLTVINDFTVETANGTTYTVKAGKYTDIPKEGLNLFDDKAKTTLIATQQNWKILFLQVLTGYKAEL